MTGQSKLRLTGITARTTLLAWTVTLVTLGIFVVIIVPEQKRDLQVGLESKARAVAAALQGEVAGAAVSEDYSSVVDHAMQMLAGDQAVSFLVIAKNDGYAVIVQHGSWRVVPKIDEDWRPGVRQTTGDIEFVPLFQQRLFHYSVPFDYSGLQWGWVHVGLSLDAYDSSVKKVYRRTGVLAVVCILLSLVASLLYAKRFVGPILRLRSVVEEVASGDLAARAHIDSADEIEQLADAFNGMADAVLQRNRIMESVRYTAQALQSTYEWDSVADGVLAKLGEAAKASRVLIFENHEGPEKAPLASARFEWAAAGIAPCIPILQDRTRKEPVVAMHEQQLANGELVAERRNGGHALSFSRIEPPPVSLLLAPIFTGRALWGALSVHDCEIERAWHEVERDSVRAVAEMLGASIVRRDAQQALFESKNELEQRVAERTLELREQIADRDRAHAELEEAQKRLIELSRLSGMAEVATGVLHNVGNVLNSINVAANLVTDRLRNSRIRQLDGLARMLSENQDNIGDFLTKDLRGQRALPYFSKLCEHLAQERDELGKELQGLVQHVGHIKEIVAMQQTYARTSGLLEKVPFQVLLHDALSIVGPGFERHGIVLTKEVEDLPPMVTDRHKVLQVLLNLLRNAKDAVKAVSNGPRQITVRVCAVNKECMKFQVVDSGIGIAPENLARIFSHGFTTKKDGHGFGLHSGALAAQQLGGSLRAESEGLGRGASFTLQLPLHAGSSDGGRV